MPVFAQIFLILTLALAGAGVTYEGITHHYIPLFSVTAPTPIVTPTPYPQPTEAATATLTPTKAIYKPETQPYIPTVPAVQGAATENIPVPTLYIPNDTYPTIFVPTPQPIPTYDSQQALKQCLDNVYNNYLAQQGQNRAMARAAGGYGSDYEEVQNQTARDYGEAQNNCHAQSGQ